MTEGYDAAGAPRQNTIGDARAYFPQQAPSFVMPKTYTTAKNATLIASPVDGMTNADNWNDYGIAMAGAVATCETQVPGVDGFVCEEPAM